MIIQNNFYYKIIKKMPMNFLYNQIFFFFFFCLFAFSRAAPAAYEYSQARGLIGAVAAKPMLEPQQFGIRAESATYTTAHSNTRSLTH